jgi:starch phosphorylase
MNDAELLTCIRSLAGNYRWAWHAPTRHLFHKADPAGLAAAEGNPWAWVRRVGEAGACDAFRRAQLESELVTEALALRHELEQPTRDGAKIAYFCFEYGIHESLPIYAGGLGVLASDHLKACSDARIDCIGVGFLYSEGYLSQGVDAHGRQTSDSSQLDKADHPMRRLPETVTVGMPGGAVHADVYELRVGRSRLLLLDTDVDRNTDPALRMLCRRLYGGDSTTRMRQEILLGIGGMRLLYRLGYADRVLHLNEGHCAFALTEAVRIESLRLKSLDAAEAVVRARSVFTTHTPVPAGHDRFDTVLAGEHLTAAFGDDSAVVEWVQRRGYEEGTSSGSICMTMLGLNLAGRSNGVSAIHGRVSREMWKRDIGHVTNGVHIASWVSAAITERPEGTDLGQARLHLRRRLIQNVRERLLAMPVRGRTGSPDNLDDQALTIGFARRFAPYKRSTLLLGATEALTRILSDVDRPVQLLFAGKAHPADRGGQELIRQVIEGVRDPRFNGRIHFIPDYDMALGRMFVQGCDLWMNTPRRPMEASGTSGQKAAMNGCLNLSVPDGWWPEGYDGTNGWMIGPDVGEVDPVTQDTEDLSSVVEMLENEIIPMFYEGPLPGRGPRWVAMMNRSIQTITAGFSAVRMVEDYMEQYYQPAWQSVAP